MAKFWWQLLGFQSSSTDKLYFIFSAICQKLIFLKKFWCWFEKYLYCPHSKVFNTGKIAKVSPYNETIFSMFCCAFYKWKDKSSSSQPFTNYNTWHQSQLNFATMLLAKSANSQFLMSVHRGIKCQTRGSFHANRPKCQKPPYSIPFKFPQTLSK